MLKARNQVLDWEEEAATYYPKKSYNLVRSLGGPNQARPPPPQKKRKKGSFRPMHGQQLQYTLEHMGFK